MNLKLDPGRFKKGEWVYTCLLCGREGELEWMQEHLKLAEGMAGARERTEAIRAFPKRREFVNVRGEY